MLNFISTLLQQIGGLARPDRAIVHRIPGKLEMGDARLRALLCEDFEHDRMSEYAVFIIGNTNVK